MSEAFSSTLPPGVLDLVPYKAGKTIDQICAERGIVAAIKLSSNENPLGSSPNALRVLTNPDSYSPHLYPDAGSVDLRKAIAESLSVDPGMVVCGNGSNEVLEMAATLALRPGRKAVYSEHAFVVYHLATHARGATPIVVPAKSFGHDLDGMAQACLQPGVGIVFVANPNNPTGTWHDPEAIASFVAKVPRKVMVVLDEAYHEYVCDEPGPTLELLGKHDNLVITRTFSKIHGLAGLRLGYGITGEQLMGLFNRIRQPFNANSAAQSAGVAALSDSDFLARSRKVNDEGVPQLMEGFANLGYVTLPSYANFVSFQSGNSQETFDALLEGGVIVRQIDEYGLAGWLRATVGTPEHNERLLAALPKRN